MPVAAISLIRKKTCPKLQNPLLMSPWSELYHMATIRCERSRENEHLSFALYQEKLQGRGVLEWLLKSASQRRSQPQGSISFLLSESSAWYGTNLKMQDQILDCKILDCKI